MISQWWNILNAAVQGVPYVFFLPTSASQIRLVTSVSILKISRNNLNSNVSSPEQRVIIGGYFNVTFDSELYNLFGWASNTEGFG